MPSAAQRKRARQQEELAGADLSQAQEIALLRKQNAELSQQISELLKELRQQRQREEAPSGSSRPGASAESTTAAAPGTAGAGLQPTAKEKAREQAKQQEKDNVAAAAQAKEKERKEKEQASKAGDSLDKEWALVTRQKGKDKDNNENKY